MHRALLALIIVALPFLVSAQIPVLVPSTPFVIESPEEFTDYYASLKGEPDSYTVSAQEPFSLTLSLLVPDTTDSKLDVSMAVIQDGATSTPLTVFNSNNAQWELSYDEGAENFFRRHSTFHSMVPEGEYEIRVWSSNNDSKYVLEVGDPKEGFSAARLKKQYAALPTIKKEFYGEPVWKAYASPALIGPVFLALLVLGLTALLAYLWKQRA